MTRKDYVALAAALHNAMPGTSLHYAPSPSESAYNAWLAACCGVADSLTKDNPRFDSERFLVACGVPQS